MKIYIWGGISSAFRFVILGDTSTVLRSEISFYDKVSAEP